MIQNPIPNVLAETKNLVFDPLGFELKNVRKETEGSEYDAFAFELGHRKVIFRNAKITPKKSGQFVTLWKRNSNGITQPFEFSDDFDLAIINVKSENHQGQFVFPKAVLLEKSIISSPIKEGKRGFRIYPPWDKTANSQAGKTQNWQLNFFLEIGKTIDPETAKKMYA